MRVLVFQHIDCEHPGRFREFLDADAVDWLPVELDAGDPIPDLDAFDVLWVMGGPMDVWDVAANPWLVEEKRAIKRWVRDLGRPFLGLCLGHQLLADALGGTCGPMASPEIGICDVHLTEAGRADTLLAAMPDPHKALQWHSAEVAQPPEDAVILAASPACPIQAMRIGPCAWSLQYHVEVEEDTVDNWSAVPAYRAALDKALGGGGAAGFARDAAAEMAAFEANAHRLYQNFLSAISA